MDRARRAHPEVLDPEDQPLRPVFPPASILPPIRPVPDVFPRDGLARGNPWPCESELVMDPISDGLTKIRNASLAHHPVVDIRFSRLFTQILDVLKQEGFIRTYKVTGDTPATQRLRVYLKYAKRPIANARKTPAITQVVRVSRPGVRMYRKAAALPRVLGGLGVAVVSTSKGILTERDAYKQRIGGEVICYVW
jgi:small subunit ribosomal protein S8